MGTRGGYEFGEIFSERPAVKWSDGPVTGQQSMEISLPGCSFEAILDPMHKYASLGFSEGSGIYVKSYRVPYVFRGMGIGTIMMKTAVKEAVERDVKIFYGYLEDEMALGVRKKVFGKYNVKSFDRSLNEVPSASVGDFIVSDLEKLDISRFYR